MSLLQIAPPPSPNPHESRLWLHGDLGFAIVSGQITVSPTATWCFFHPARAPHIAAGIRAELGPLIGSDGTFPAHALRTDAPYLNAVLAETLRLQPPNPSGVVRQTPPEGITVGRTAIPGDVALYMPFVAIHRCTFLLIRPGAPSTRALETKLTPIVAPASFVDPEAFIPERWTTRRELVRRPAAYLPFGAGAYGCISRQLGLMELRAVVARLLWRFDVALAPGEDRARLRKESRDVFAMVCGPLMLSFTPR